MIKADQIPRFKTVIFKPKDFPSTLMEVEALTDLTKIEKFHSITAFVSDNNAKAGKVVAKSGAQCLILKDVNHTILHKFTNDKFDFLEERFREIMKYP